VLGARLETRPTWPQLRAVYLDLAPLVGKLQGLTRERVNESAEADAAYRAEAALDRFKTLTRKVGLDMRLTSEAGLIMGLHACLQSARETLDCLQALSDNDEPE